MLAACAACFVAACACACGSSDGPAVTPAGDGGPQTGDGATSPPTAGDAAGDGASDAGSSCDGPCDATRIVVTFGAKSVTLTRAQFGYNAAQDGSPQTLHIEAYAGGSPECPTSSSPTPDQTLILTGVTPTVGPFSSAGGVRVSLLDFKDTFGLPVPNVGALDVTGKVTSVVPGDAGALSAEITATFDGGTLSGTLGAARCTTLDEL